MLRAAYRVLEMAKYITTPTWPTVLKYKHNDSFNDAEPLLKVTLLYKSIKWVLYKISIRSEVCTTGGFSMYHTIYSVISKKWNDNASMFLNRNLPPDHKVTTKQSPSTFIPDENCNGHSQDDVTFSKSCIFPIHMKVVKTEISSFLHSWEGFWKYYHF